jgi:hypothetical protein
MASVPPAPPPLHDDPMMAAMIKVRLTLTEEQLSNDALCEKLAACNNDADRVVAMYSAAEHAAVPPPSRFDVEASPTSGSVPQDSYPAGNDDGDGLCAGLCSDIYDTCGSEGLCASSACCFCICFICVVVALALGLRTIEPTEQVIGYNDFTCTLHGDVYTEGLHMAPFFGYWIYWPKLQKTMQEDLNCLTKEGVTVTTKIAYQYSVDSNYLKDLTLKYKDHDTWKVSPRTLPLVFFPARRRVSFSPTFLYK